MVERHLADCPACRAEAEILRSILANARALPRSVRRSIPVDRYRIAPLELTGRRFANLSRTSRLALQMAAAIGLILFGAALATALSGRRAPTAFATEQARYNSASATLAEQLTRNPSALSPDTRAVVQRNLAIVDAAIKEAEAALTVDHGIAASLLLNQFRNEMTHHLVVISTIIPTI